MNTKKLAFVVMMGALGDVLFAISYSVGLIAPGVALDLSLIPVFIAGFFVGPVEGAATGVIAGVLPGIMFGPAGSGGWLGLIGLPLGKALTGLTSGFIARGFSFRKTRRRAVFGVPLTLTAYIPEGLFTFTYFSFLLPIFFPSPYLTSAVITTIMIKAIVEVTIMGFVMAALLGNKGFNDFIGAFFCKPQMTPTLESKAMEKKG